MTQSKLAEQDQPSASNALLCGFCSSLEITTEHNVGSDIWEGGEETQHIDICDKCGAWRFNCDVIDWDKGPLKSYGKWYPAQERGPYL